uniref:Major facilitator superfamily (MFS) profile domain-containing protein n=1 Tax=Bionectria ochroleuca TaxID=29856 RepID=A0A0B7JJH1_BIOOC
MTQENGNFNGSVYPNLFGPLLAPVISGYCSTTIGWRWVFWIALIFGGACLPAILWVPETFGPALLTRRAKKIREADPTAQIFSVAELEPRDLKQLVTRVLTRPINMLVSELIVSSTCAYLALCYVILYMTFQAFPLIFRDLYGLSPGVTGLCFLSVGAGCILALPMAFSWNGYLSTSKARGDPWTKNQENYRFPLAVAGGPMFATSFFWLGWSARTDISFVLPLLAGIPFGCGFTLIFIAMLSYFTDAYEIYSASANAASSGSRSLLAVVLPLATLPMIERLGIAGACTLLGGLSGIMCLIPFVFIWKGERIRARSKFCIALKTQKCEMGERSEAIESSG